MQNKTKNLKAILAKLHISELNKMQLESFDAILKYPDILLLSPTGSGKTLAFLLPTFETMDPDFYGIQTLIIVPTRELAIQIEQVIRNIGSGFKVNAVYGGRSGSKDRNELLHPPSILIGTPGRIADHIRNKVIDTSNIKTLILDEFDKTFESGFEAEMKEIIPTLKHLEKRILTSATQKVKVPSFIGITNRKNLNFLVDQENKLKLQLIQAKDSDKKQSLLILLSNLQEARGIVFCNLKASINEISDFLNLHKISHGLFYGDLDQLDRERALVQFRNGSHQILLSTDLAARGIDVPALDYIIHFDIAEKEDEFIHRNGRTARMQAEGIAYLIQNKNQVLPAFIPDCEESELSLQKLDFCKEWSTLYLNGGRRDKISKGDIAGLFFKQGLLDKQELGVIELKQECAYVAVPPEKTKSLIELLNNAKLKRKKLRVSLLKSKT